MTPPFRAGAGVLAVAGLSIAVWQSARLTFADWVARGGTPAALQRSLAIVPENAHAHLVLALLLQDTDPVGSRREFEAAAHYNRWDSRSLVELGLLAEKNGNYPQAEKLLLEAARVDALYFPRWSLANYYLRRGDERNFWKWSRSAATMPFGSMASLYRLAAYAAGDRGNAVSLLNLQNPGALKGYLEFAMSAGRFEEVKEVARRLHRDEDRPTILRACNVLIRSGRVRDAVEICPQPLEFRNTAGTGGFEWHFLRVDGLETALLNHPRALRLRLYDRRPERCELLWRYVPVSGPGEVTVSADLYTRSLPRESGLHWELFDPVSDANVGRQETYLSAADWTAGRVSIDVRKETKGLRLALVYERAPGTVRTAGDIVLRRVQVTGGAP
jgi:tetratricopeptide (TPR) repeat protein